VSTVQLPDHSFTISLGTGPTQNTPNTAPQDAQNAIATPLPSFGARNETSRTISLQLGHFGSVVFIDSDFILSFQY
jgi:hypothetical protein